MTHAYCSTRLLALSLAAAFAIVPGTGCHTASPLKQQALVQTPRGATFAPPPVTQNLPLVPDPQLTPGATLPVTRDDICAPGYTQKVRNVPEAVKRQVYAAYGIASHRAGDFEVDHLISLELGGSNSPKNLWPESYKTHPWNARVKDALENRLHADICTNQIDMATAQREIATDWIGAYKRVFGTTLPVGEASGRRHRPSEASYDTSPPAYSASPSASPVSSPQAPGNEQVWVNTRSGKYFHSGSAHYGTTKQGAHMSEQEAVQHGYAAAQGQ